jgi:hypothetical protein
MNLVKITGGPSSATVKVVLIGDDGTERDITSHVLDFDLVACGGGLMTARLKMFAKVEVAAEALMAKPIPYSCGSCEKEPTKVVVDMVRVLRQGSSFQSYEPIGIVRAGCSYHPVEARVYEIEDVPRHAPWWRRTE